MKSIFLGAIGTVALSSTVFAADLPVRIYNKAPAPVTSSIYDWSGFYLGLNGGGGSGHQCWTLTAALPRNPGLNLDEGCHNATGILAGGQIGYRLQRANFVFGIEAQGDWANLVGSNLSVAPNVASINQTTVSALGLFTGQVGYAWNNVLWFVKGGAAVAADKYSGLLPFAIGPLAAGSIIDQGTEKRWGGAIGSGLEFGFAPNWSVGVEYDHLFMGTRSVMTYDVAGTPGVPSRIDSIRQGIDIGLVRVNYTFGSGPVVAKY